MYIFFDYKSYNSIADLYVYFIERSINSLSEKGFLSYITPNKFLKANYGKQIRDYLRENSKINLIYNFDDYQVFEDATNYPLIFIINKIKDNKSNAFIYSKFENTAESNVIDSFRKSEMSSALLASRDFACFFFTFNSKSTTLSKGSAENSDGNSLLLIAMPLFFAL